jgi:hypothetical protein
MIIWITNHMKSTIIEKLGTNYGGWYVHVNMDLNENVYYTVICSGLSEYITFVTNGQLLCK